MSDLSYKISYKRGNLKIVLVQKRFDSITLTTTLAAVQIMYQKRKNSKTYSIATPTPEKKTTQKTKRKHLAYRRAP